MKTAKNTLCSNLGRADLYGEYVQFTFQGHRAYSSPIGKCFSCLTITMFIAFFAVRSIKFWSSEDPFFAMIDQGSDYEAVDLLENGYFFAVEKIDERAGRIKTSLVRD